MDFRKVQVIVKTMTVSVQRICICFITSRVSKLTKLNCSTCCYNRISQVARSEQNTVHTQKWCPENPMKLCNFVDVLCLGMHSFDQIWHPLIWNWKSRGYQNTTQHSRISNQVLLQIVWSITQTISFLSLCISKRLTAKWECDQVLPVCCMILTKSQFIKATQNDSSERVAVGFQSLRNFYTCYICFFKHFCV